MNKEEQLEDELEEELERIDDDIVSLLKKRQRVNKRLSEARGSAYADRQTTQKLLDNASNQFEAHNERQCARDIFRQIIKLCRIKYTNERDD